MPKRIQRKRTKGWRMPGGAVYVGRPSRWGNPYKVGMHYQVTLLTSDPEQCQQIMEEHQAREPSVTFYRRHPSWTFYRFDITDRYSAALAYRLNIESYYGPEIAKPLRGQDLACWCPLDQPCHADVLISLANK